MKRRLFDADGFRLRRRAEMDAMMLGEQRDGSAESHAAKPGAGTGAGAGAAANALSKRVSAPAAYRAGRRVGGTPGASRGGFVRQGRAAAPLLVALSDVPQWVLDSTPQRCLDRLSATYDIPKPAARRNTTQAGAAAGQAAARGLDLRRCEFQAAQLLWSTVAALLRLDAAVLQLQAAVRGSLQRLRFAALRRRRDNAARCIQWGWEGLRGRRIARDYAAVKYSTVERVYDFDAEV